MVIGLTGGIASGKSTVSSMLVALGAELIDADKIAREVVEPGQAAWLKLKEAFPEDIFYPDGQLNRAQLGEIVFQDEQVRQKLNAIIHPEIRRVMIAKRDAAIQAKKELIVLDIPLLFESGLEYMVDKILVVYVPQEIQIKRLMERDSIDQAFALQKINSQLSMEQKKEQGDAVIDNSGSREETIEQLEQILRRWRQEEPC